MLHSLMWTSQVHDGTVRGTSHKNVIHSDDRWTLFCLYLTLMETAQGKDGDLHSFSCIVYGKHYNDPVALNESDAFFGIRPPIR